MPIEFTPPVAYRFAVVFFANGLVPNPLDIRFQKVSGISTSVNTDTLREGGENLFSYHLPTGIDYGELELTRGQVKLSPLDSEFNKTLSKFEFSPSNVLVSALDESGIPKSAWLFLKAYPSSWSSSDFDGENNGIVINSMKLRYTRWKKLS